MARQNMTTTANERVAIVAGLRTPFARQGTVLRQMTAIDLGIMVVSELVARADIAPQLIEQVVFGQVIQMPEAPNIAREIVLGSELGVSTDAYSVTRACATSFQTVACVAQSIINGDIDIGIAGGADSASVLPVGVSKKLAATLLAVNKARSISKKIAILSSLRGRDLLPVPPSVTEYSTGLSMGQTAEQMAKTYSISRVEQDEFAHRSHTLAANAWNNSVLNDEVMVAYPKPYQQWLQQDNTIRFDSNIDKYARLRPAFDAHYGSVTAGNSSALTDGAAAVLLMREGRARELGCNILGFVSGYAFSAIGVNQDMLMGPAYATACVLANSGMELNEFTLIDMHEAFAAQVLTNVKIFASDSYAQQHLGRNRALGNIDMERFNVLGGSIAYGHPFAATGARMIIQTLYELKRRGGGRALTCACAAGGLGAAMILEAES